MKKKNGLFVFSMWWFLSCAIVGCLVLFFTPDRERVSMEEKRTLENAPAFTFAGFFSGEYAEKFENYLSDSVPGRRYLIKLSDSIMNLFCRNTDADLAVLDTTEEDIKKFLNEDDEVQVPGDDTGQSDGESDVPDHSDDVESDIDSASVRVTGNNGGVTVLSQYSAGAMKRSAENLEKLASLLPEGGKLYFTTMQFPVKLRFFTENIADYKGWECDLPEKMDKLTSDRIVCVDSYRILEPHIMAGEEVFLYTDHQWNDRGAYYVFSSIIESQGLTPTPYDEYDYDVNRVPYSENGGGYDEFNLLYPLAPSHNWRVSHVDRREEVPFMYYHHGATVSYLSGTQGPWKLVETGFHTGRNALVIGDCFSLAVSPYLLPYYDTVNYTRLKKVYFDRSALGTSVAEMIEKYNITDVYYIASESSGVNTPTLQYYVGVNIY